MKKLTHNFCRVRVDLNDTITVTQEYDGHLHRLVCGQHASEWAGYPDFSILVVPNVGQFIGTSDYYSPILPRIIQKIDPLVLPDQPWTKGDYA